MASAIGDSMEHTRQKEPSEVITVISDRQGDIVELVEIGGTVTRTVITPTYETLTDSYYKFTYTTPDTDCIVCLLAGEPLLLRVGNPPIRYYIYSDTPVDWVRTVVGTGSQEVGQTSDLGYGLHASSFSDLEYSLLEVAGLHTVTIDVPYSAVANSTTGTEGTITLQRGVWQLIAIPVTDVNVAEYFVDRLAAQEGVADTELIERCSAYRGSVNDFSTYVPGVTNKLSVENFPLVTVDGTSEEYTAFWVKMKYYTHTTADLVYSWSRV